MVVTSTPKKRDPGYLCVATAKHREKAGEGQITYAVAFAPAIFWTYIQGLMPVYSELAKWSEVLRIPGLGWRAFNTLSGHYVNFGA